MSTTVTFEEIERKSIELKNNVFADDRLGEFDIIVSYEDKGLWGMRSHYRVPVNVVHKQVVGDKFVIVAECNGNYQDLVYDENHKLQGFTQLSKMFEDDDKEYTNPMTIGDFWKSRNADSSKLPEQVRKSYPFTAINLISSRYSEKYNILLS